MVQPERNMAEGTPGPGPDAEAVRQAGYIQPPIVGQVPETLKAVLEVRNQLGGIEGAKLGELEPEDVVEKLQEIDNMEAEAREAEKDVYQQACDILKEYAHKSKLLGLDNDIIKLERTLDKQDEEEIQKQPPEKQLVLQQLLDNFDATREELRRLKNTLKEDGLKALYSEKDWEKKQGAQGKLEADQATLEQQLIAMTGSGFLDARKKSEDGIKQKKGELEVAQREKQERKVEQRRAEPEPWEKGLEEMLLIDAEPTITGPVAATFSLQLAEFQKQQHLSETNDPDFSQADLERAQEGLSWYSHEARRRGILGDLEDRLEYKYTEWRNSTVPHREVSQMDMLTESPGRITRKTFADVEDEIVEYFDSLLDESRPQFVEHAARWDRLQRRGMFPSVAREALQGIRVEFVRRAQAQITDSLSGATPPARISGEWNVQGIEMAIEQKREQQSLEAGIEPMFREESYYRIRLLGTNRKDIELGADQAADNIIQSATNFDLNTMQQRMEMLLKAIREKSPDLQRNDRVSESEAETIIKQIEDSVTNKIDFFILDWAGRNLQMELFSSYMEQRLRIRGVEKLRRLPAMSDGLVGIALHLFMDPNYRLYFRPQGFKGQIFDDDTTHKYLRDKLKDKMIGLLMQYEIKGVTKEEQSQNRDKLTKASSFDEFLSCFEHIESPKTKLKQIGEEYQKLTEEVKTKKDRGEATNEDLQRLRGKRSELARVQSLCERIESRATSAFEVAEQAMNVFGESASLGAPSIVMDNGDYIRVEDAVLFYKYAILQKAKETWKDKGITDNMALIRWRSKMWIDGWKKAGLNRSNAPRKFTVPLKGGQQVEFTLQSGFEETGLTEEEWRAFSDTVVELRRKGHTAKIGGVPFEDIIKMDNLRPVMNNFLADYKSSESQINNEVVLEEVAKGKLLPIKKILRRLGLKGREGIRGATTQQRIDNLTQMIEDSRALDAELERLAYFEATHGLPQPGQDPRMLPFSADRIDYGFQGMSWGVKRLQHLKAFWYTNLRRTVPRAVDLIHAMPFALGSLSKEMDFDSILDLALSVNTTANGMESVDNPALTMYAQRFKDMVSIRGRGEGSVAESQGDVKKLWGFLEKPLVDANSLWKQIRFFGQLGVRENLDKALQDPAHNIPLDSRENLINYLQEVTLKRLEPIISATEKLLGEDRQALSSGAGYEENEKFALRFLEFIMSTKEGSEREQGGMQFNKEIRDVIRLITLPNSYRVEDEKTGIKRASFWDEVWRKLTPSHNPRLPEQVPAPTYQ